MTTTRTLPALTVLLALMLGMWWLWEYREIKATVWHPGELTAEKKELLNKAWRRHGYYRTIESVEGIYMESPNGRIWIERR